jgi:putative Mn2+ efflux pump MntP
LLQLVALALSMGIDNLSVAVGIGLSGVTPRQTLGIACLFTFFQTALPALGLWLGAYLGGHVGKVASLVGFGLLIALGAYTALTADGERRRPAAERGTSMLVAAVAVSLDSLAIGFSLSFVGLRPGVVIAALGASALLMTWVGLHFGDRIGRRAGALAELVAGLVLAATGAVLLFERLSAG